MEAAITEINGLGWFQIRTALLIVRDPRPAYFKFCVEQDIPISRFSNLRLKRFVDDSWISYYSNSIIGCTGAMANASLFWSSFATRM